MPYIRKGRLEAGCDEAGRGPLAGPVTAAAVLLPDGYSTAEINDSKKLSASTRERIRHTIETNALAWAVAVVEPAEIDRLNILHAATHAMSLAVMALMGEHHEGVSCGGLRIGEVKPEILLVDGNRFYNETPLPYQCIVKGDAQLLPIAAASILAKTYRDEIMIKLSNQYPGYGWERNKGYPTAEHYDAIERLGITPVHRRSFTLYRQHTLFEQSHNLSSPCANR